MSADAADTRTQDASQITLERIDGLISQLERAAEQLRSGELSADAAATVVEDCAALATEASGEMERLARAGWPVGGPADLQSASISPRAPNGVSIDDRPAQQVPGQDSLL